MRWNWHVAYFSSQKIQGQVECPDGFQLVNLHNLIVCGRTIEYHHDLSHHIKTGEDDYDL